MPHVGLTLRSRRQRGITAAMAMLDELAEKLANSVLDAVKKTGDSSIVEKVAKTVGDTSSTLQEAYLTAVRLRTASERGHEALDAIMSGDDLDILDNPDL